MQPQPTKWPGWRIAWWALAATIALAWQGRSLLRDMKPPGHVVVDFFQEWASARNFLSGHPIYEPQRASCMRYLGCAPDGDSHFFLEINAHPPTTVLLGLPLARLDYPTAVFAWNLVSLAAVAASAWLVFRQLDLRLQPWMILPAAVFVLLCWPLRSHLAQGQLATVLLLLITGAWAADRSGRQTLAGTLLGAAAVLKLFPALLFLYFILRRQWRAVAAGLACCGVLTAVTAAVLGPAAYATYLRDVPPFVAEWRSAWNNSSLPGLWSKLFEPGTKGNGIVPLVYNPALAHVLVVISCSAVIFLVARATRQARSVAERDGAFAAAVAA
ncbi:MAG TPA: glycosyltransferase family 87 protein, partial [Gemmataceae bacterium]|nr:glycosyltransferase family 87 protein [Gemmataceae bacterium]